MPQTFLQYAETLGHLQTMSQHTNPNEFLRQILRKFEHELIEELGYPLDFSVDASQDDIQPLQHYQFLLNAGFMPVVQASRATLSGQQILSMCDYEKGMDFNPEQLQLLSKLYRQMISSLLGDRPLKSRQLWIQNSQTKA